MTPAGPLTGNEVRPVNTLLPRTYVLVRRSVRLRFAAPPVSNTNTNEKKFVETAGPEPAQLHHPRRPGRGSGMSDESARAVHPCERQHGAGAHNAGRDR